jgi:hypothetical protein
MARLTSRKALEQMLQSLSGRLILAASLLLRQGWDTTKPTLPQRWKCSSRHLQGSDQFSVHIDVGNYQQFTRNPETT